MASKHLTKIFLSASIPSVDRDEKFYKTADIIAIRDAIRALAAVVIPRAQLVWGGHPSITPLIRNVMTKMSTNLQHHVTIYQSLFFENYFPADNYDFENIVSTAAIPDNRIASLEVMRKEMFKSNEFKVAIFIGGMEGIFEEYEMFRSYHPNAAILPIATTGAAAKILYDITPENYDSRLLTDYAYISLFKELLQDYLIS